MGCTESKLDNEDTVQRCKERRRLMKEAVYARRHLATAQSDYCRSLRITGSALVTFSSGEPLSVSQHTPAVLLRTPSSTIAPNFKPPSSSVHPPPPISPPSSRHLHQEPSPPMSTTPNHQQPPPIRRKRQIKLPHILSESSLASSPPPNHNSTYSTTPSQVSSVWNWDTFCPPPSPPDSDYFDRKNTTTNHPDHDKNDDKSSTYTSYSNARNQGDEFQNPFSKQFNHQASNYSSHSGFTDNSYSRVQKKGQSLNPRESEEEETEREEVQCSEWGDHDHYSSTTTSSDEDEVDDLNSRSVKDQATKASAMFSSKVENDDKSSVSNERVDSERRIMVRHKDLAEIVTAINEYFGKAASAGDQVSEILEIGRAQLDRNFSQLKKRVYHSSGMLSKLSSSWTSKPPLGVKYQFEGSSLEQSGGTKSLCSTLERLLAWEKKLYQEVKAREGVKIEHEKKLSSLQSQEYRGGQDAKLDKTKASINKLQSLIVVTSQAVTTTSSAIVSLRDSDLVPQLVELCHGYMYMWRSMHQFHEIQNDIVQQVRGLINDTNKGVMTSDLHKQATRDLESAISAWHSSFCSVLKYQRDFIHSLHGWFKLTLLPVNTETTNGNRDLLEVSAFCDEWKLSLDRIPDTVASEAIKSFINVVHSISMKQAEELKIKKRTETASKELEKKSSSLRHIERKYYQSYSTVGIGVPDTGPDNSHTLDARDPLVEKKAELATCQRLVEDEMLKHTKAVEITRAMTLNNIQTGLPGVFQAMTSFSALMTEALETVCTHSYSI